MHKHRQGPALLLRSTIALQSIYYFGTGVWPVLHIPSFLLVTGHKTDLWLVKMVGLLSVAIAITLLVSTRSKGQPLTTLGASAALAFAAIDLYYAIAGIIPRIYLADAALQVLFIILLATGQWQTVKRRAARPE